MRTILARNAHQALAESCFQVDTFGVTDEHGGKVLPIPTATTILYPLERVALYPGLDPFAALLNAARGLAENRMNHAGTGAEALKKNPATRVSLTPTGECDNIGVVYVQIDMDGKLMLLAHASRTDVVNEGDLVYLSMVMEYMAASCKREVSALWYTSMRPSCCRLDTMRSIASAAPQPPAQFEDPYSNDTIKNTMPLMSLPRGRWDRELKQFFSNDTYDSVDYIDPFIQHVLAPAHRAQQLIREKAPLAAVQRAIGEIAAQDWMQACLLYSNQPILPSGESEVH